MKTDDMQGSKDVSNVPWPGTNSHSPALVKLNLSGPSALPITREVLKNYRLTNDYAQKASLFHPARG